MDVRRSARYIRSGTAMTDTRDDDFTTTRNWFIRDGVIVSKACGRMIHRIVRQGDSPVDRAASRWPRLTASIPARNVSARYPLDCRAKAAHPASKNVVGQPTSSGQTWLTHMSWT